MAKPGKVSYKHGCWGIVCPRHPKLGGLRQRVSRSCVGCRRDAAKLRYRRMVAQPSCPRHRGPRVRPYGKCRACAAALAKAHRK